MEISCILGFVNTSDINSSSYFSFVFFEMTNITGGGGLTSALVKTQYK